MFRQIAIGALMLIGSWSQLQAKDEVAVLASTNVTMSKYGMSWQSPQVRLRVKDIAYEKSVIVVFTDSEGNVTSSPATYVGPADSGYELWEAYGNVRGGAAANFHVEYTVANQIYFDSNQGQDFPLKQGPVLYRGQNIQQVLGSKQFYGSNAYFTAAVRNLAYQKNVQVHYSYDGFRTQQSASLSFQPYYYYGYGAISSPTPEGFEVWTGSVSNIPDTASAIFYYFTYEVGKQKFADVNFGQNYIMLRN